MNELYSHITELNGEADTGKVQQKTLQTKNCCFLKKTTESGYSFLSLSFFPQSSLSLFFLFFSRSLITSNAPVEAVAKALEHPLHLRELHRERCPGRAPAAARPHAPVDPQAHVQTVL